MGIVSAQIPAGERAELIGLCPGLVSSNAQVRIIKKMPPPTLQALVSGHQNHLGPGAISICETKIKCMYPEEMVVQSPSSDSEGHSRLYTAR